MSSLTAVVGWIRGLFGFQAVEEVSASEAGYRFEHDELKRLMARLSSFPSVEFSDAYGGPLTAEIIAQRKGPDGGVDCVIRIIAPTEKGAKNVAGRIRSIIRARDY